MNKIFFTAILLFGSFVFADGIVNPILTPVDAKIQTLQQAPQFTPTVRDAQGFDIHMTRDQAIKYCKSQGHHLPSARELALLATSLGAAGISNTAQSRYDLKSEL
jgi:hypothetical protein